jgi:hypothetical protein
MADTDSTTTEGKGQLPKGYIWPLSPEQRQKKADRARLCLALAGVFSEELPAAPAARYLAGLRGEITRLLAHLEPADLLAIDLLVMQLAQVGPVAGWRQRLGGGVR